MIAQALMPEMQHEYANTRKMLESVPFEAADWKPHDKSMTLKRLAVHIATLPQWVNIILSTKELDITSSPFSPPAITGNEALMQWFNTTSKASLTALETASDEALRASWILKRGELIIFTLPRIAAIRFLVANHSVHHRGQLSVYLRLLNIKVPGMYGPSADEV